MHPVLLELAGLELRSYAVFILLGALVAGWIRAAEVARLGYDRSPGHAWVGLGALIGAMLGAKLGMVLFEPLDGFRETLARTLTLDFAGKTVVGGIAGGYLGVELTKKVVGVRHSTGDGFAVALPVAQALGRVGCFLEGCCYGAPWDGAWSVWMAGARRHPAQLYEVALDLLLAGWLWSIRREPRPQGHLFRRYLVGYALIRAALEPLRGEPVRMVGPISLVALFCLGAALAFSLLIWRGERRARAT